MLWEENLIFSVTVKHHRFPLSPAGISYCCGGSGTQLLSHLWQGLLCVRRQQTCPTDSPCSKQLKTKSVREPGRFKSKSKLPKQGTSVHRSCPAPAGSQAGGRSYASQCWLFLQSTIVLFFCRFCSLTPSSVMGISNGCFHPEGTFVKAKRSASGIPRESMGRPLVVWLQLVLPPDLYGKEGGRKGKSMLWQLS